MRIVPGELQTIVTGLVIAGTITHAEADDVLDITEDASEWEYRDTISFVEATIGRTIAPAEPGE